MVLAITATYPAIESDRTLSPALGARDNTMTPAMQTTTLATFFTSTLSRRMKHENKYTNTHADYSVRYIDQEENYVQNSGIRRDGRAR